MSDKHGRPFGDLPNTGLLRLADIVKPNGLLPISRSSWYEGIRAGRFPRALRLGPKLPVWRAEDIRKLLEAGIGPHG